MTSYAATIDPAERPLLFDVLLAGCVETADNKHHKPRPCAHPPSRVGVPARGYSDSLDHLIRRAQNTFGNVNPQVPRHSGVHHQLWAT